MSDGLTATLIGTRMTLMGTDKCKQRFSQRRKGPSEIETQISRGKPQRNALMAYGHWLIERILPYSQNDSGFTANS